MTPEEIQTAFSAQIEINRQANERLTRIEQQTAENSQAIQALSRDVSQLVVTQQQTGNYLQGAVEDVVAMIGSLAESQDTQGRRVDQLVAEAAQDRQQAAQDRQEIRLAVGRIEQAIQELQAANLRQERVNDFLLREQGLN
jgi:uncharacterized coiled-coil protein SlyX